MPVHGDPAQTHPEDTGERCLHHAGVGARMGGGIASDGGHPGAAIGPDREYEQGGQPGRQVVGDVIESGAGPAEPEVAVASVADHRVEGVGHAIAQQSRHAGDRTPEQGCHGSIGGVLRDGLDGRPRHPRAVQACRVAPTQTRDEGTRGFDLVCCQGVTESLTDRCERGATEGDPGRNRGGHDAAAAAQVTGTDRAADADRGENHSGPAGVAVHPVFQVPGGHPHPRDGMQSHGITEPAVQQITGGHTCGSRPCN